jgi:hypothetical protein
MSHTSSRIDECEMHGRGFVDLGSGVGQVSLSCRMMLSQPSRVGLHRFTSLIQHLAGVHDGCCVVLCMQVGISFMNCITRHSCVGSCFGIEIMQNPAHYAVDLLSL